jgi:hypothetical protein
MGPQPPQMDEAAPPAAARPSALRAWIVNHDNSWLFVIVYTASAMLLGLLVNLFWLSVVVAVHAVFEWVRQSHLSASRGGVVRLVAWEMKLDVSLVFLALAMTVYLDVAIGLMGLGSAARLGALAAARGMSRGARGLGWMRALRGILLSVDDFINAINRVVAGFRQHAAAKAVDPAQPAAAPTAPTAPTAPAAPLAPWRRWGASDHVAIWLTLGSLALLALAPFILPGEDGPSIAARILHEMRPVPAD